MLKRPEAPEQFQRVVGHRSQPTPGQAPDSRARAAHTQLLSYTTRAPKGVYRYRDHQSMDADRLRWTVELMVEKARRG